MKAHWKKALVLSISAVIAGTLSMVGSSAFAQSGKKVRIQIAHGASEGYHMHRALVKMKEELEKSGGFDVRIFPSSQFGNDTEMIESVTTGDLNMAFSPSSFFTKHSKRMNFIELPYVFPSREAAIKTLGSDWGIKALDELHASGLVGVGFMENGLRHLTNSKREVALPTDLKGMKLRTMQVPAHVEFWNLTGASASGSPFPELYTNLSTGVFDGQENPIAHIYTQKFYEVQKFLTLTGHVYTTYVGVTNKSWWDKLPVDTQKQVKQAVDNAYVYQLKLIDDEEKKQLETMSKSLVVKILTPAQIDEWMKLAAPLNQKYATKIGQDIYNEFLAAIKVASGK